MSFQTVPVVSSRVMAPEQFMEAIRGANLEACQLSRAPVSSDLSRLLLPGACLDFAHVGPAMLFSGAMPRDCYTLLYVTACPEVGRSFNFGMDHGADYMGVFAPGSPVDAATPVGYRVATLTVPVAEFEARFASHLPEPARRLLAQGVGLRIPAPAKARLRAVLEVVEGLIDDPAQPLIDPALRREIGRSVSAVFLAALEAGCEERGSASDPRVFPRYQRLRQARDYLAAHARQPVYLENLSEALGLRPRAVENLFQDLLGVTPTTYLRHQRLHGVRRALQRTDASFGAVKHAALEWGFWHQGHFARDYRALFGESPSSTLLRR